MLNCAIIEFKVDVITKVKMKNYIVVAYRHVLYADREVVANCFEMYFLSIYQYRAIII